MNTITSATESSKIVELHVAIEFTGCNTTNSEARVSTNFWPENFDKKQSVFCLFVIDVYFRNNLIWLKIRKNLEFLVLELVAESGG